MSWSSTSRCCRTSRRCCATARRDPLGFALLLKFFVRAGRFSDRALGTGRTRWWSSSPARSGSGLSWGSTTGRGRTIKAHRAEVMPGAVPGVLGGRRREAHRLADRAGRSGRAPTGAGA
ncbi:hypothetical protein HBB16_02590 [Pseudonocardia sp. MCCB 268]|nr:hypothetical protein [Pseudonocardia cytotoxica]